MSVLFLRLAGPMQSWGLSSRFTERDTAREPTKSAVIGLLCAALGKPREETPNDGFPTLAELATMRMGVRVDCEGILRREFQTAGGGTWPGRENYGVAKASGAKGDTVISNRYYLADAVFLVGLAGDKALIQRLRQALSAPVWPPFLGRKGFPPSEPLLLRDDDVTKLDESKSLEDAFRLVRWFAPAHLRLSKPNSLRLVIECRESEDGETRQDVPLSFESTRRALGNAFGIRRVKEERLEVNSLPAPLEVEPCT